jgi:predicted  nucleic acid-binding Zn-ribbon protein
MMKFLRESLHLLDWSNYKKEESQLSLSNNKICDLECQITELLNQIQELKAMNHYQAFELEQTIAHLRKQLSFSESRVTALSKEKRSLRNKIEASKRHSEKTKKDIKNDRPS